MIIPSIDIMGGKAVQLVQGDENQKRIERDNVVALAKGFNQFGQVAIIDLDAAFSKGDNEELISNLCRVAECRVGGGIRDEEKADRILGYGARKIIIGTKATPDFLSQFDPKRVIVAVDSRDGKVTTHGWKISADVKPLDRIVELQNYCSEFLYTNVNKEGMMQGVDWDGLNSLLSVTDRQLTYAGGVTSLGDIVSLEKRNVNSQIGMALYTGKISLSDAFIEVLDFQKGDGLIPTIVQDEMTNQVLMLAYSSKESLRATFGEFDWDYPWTEKPAAYYSRSRQKLWIKGSSSGNVQHFIKARYDCDRDSLLFTVRQHGVACHLGRHSCFEERVFSLNDLQKVVMDRIRNSSKESYTSKLLQSDKLLKDKILEEAEEVCQYEDRSNLIWEVADLTYFLTVLLTSQGITWCEVQNELWRRRK